MPYYPLIKSIIDTKTKERTVKRLIDLRTALKEIPEKITDKNLLIATWNIREFDSDAYGKRSLEAMYYITEIVNRFDLVAIQEVRDNLYALNELMSHLGKWWDCVFTDVAEGSGGNHERLAFVYDTRRISFSGLAGEIVIPPEVGKDEKGKRKYKPSEQFFRTPFIVGFQSGWFKFMISTVHIIYGESISDSPKRIKEISLFSDFLAKRLKGRKALYDNLIILGDFNIFKPDNKTFKEIEKNFTVPKELQELPSNALKNKHYDQIAYKLRDKVKMTNAGVFDYFQYVYKLEDEQEYIKEMGEAYMKTSKGIRSTKSKTSYYKTYWRTHQMSDHLPMWTEFEIDFSEKYLKSLV